MAAAKKAYLPDPTREANAVRIMRENIAILDGDDELLLDMIEGETGFMECLDALLIEEANTSGLIDGIKSAIEALGGRKARFEKRKATLRALIEQALMIAEIDVAIERPAATISLAKRPPVIVIETEADIPAEYWKSAEPTLDRKALGEALKARAKALETLPEDADARAAAIATLPPEIPGVTLSNAAPTLTLRSK
jgi:hypothetical protein